MGRRLNSVDVLHRGESSMPLRSRALIRPARPRCRRGWTPRVPCVSCVGISHRTQLCVMYGRRTRVHEYSEWGESRDLLAGDGGVGWLVSSANVAAEVILGGDTEEQKRKGVAKVESGFFFKQKTAYEM